MIIIFYVILYLCFFFRYIYIKTQFYKTKGVANGNGGALFEEFIYGYNGKNYVSSIPQNILCPCHGKGSVCSIWVKKKDPYKAVMGNEPYIYLVISIAVLTFIVLFLSSTDNGFKTLILNLIR